MVIEAENLTVSYKSFSLKNAKLSLEKGCILGIVGRNGAGKTTLFNGLLDLVPKSSGTVRIFETDHRRLTPAQKGRLAVFMGDVGIFATAKLKKLNAIMKAVFEEWDEKQFFDFCRKFELPEKARYQQLSRGMKMKLQLAVAFSHHAELFILDEPTAGLDPLARIELLEIIRDFALESGVAVLLSSHITTDLEKICDYIAFIENGVLSPAEEKDALLERYVKIKCTREQLDSIAPAAIVGVRENAFGVEALVLSGEINESFPAEKATLEDIMVFMWEKKS